MKEKTFLCAGEIVGVHGIRGVVRVRSYCESPIFMPDTPMLLKTPDGQHRTYTIRQVQPHRQGLLIGFEEIADRNDAEMLIGSEFLIERSALPEPEEDSYYWADIIGISVHTEDGKYLGKVDSIFPTGANDVYVVKDGKEEIMLPVIDSVIMSISLKEKKIIVKLPE